MLKKPNQKTIIFDMDGVISDSPFLGAEIYKDLFAKLGIHMSVEEIMRESAGIPDPVTVPKIFSRHKVTADIDSIMNRKWEMLKEKYKASPKRIPGAVEFIQLLHDHGYKLALASSSRRDFVMTVLDTLAITPYFSHIISMEEVTRGKPAPDIFLLAARKTGVDPKNCIVFEDAPAGVAAAKKAGMTCVAITTTHKKEDLRNANKIINAFTEISIESVETL